LATLGLVSQIGIPFDGGERQPPKRPRILSVREVVEAANRALEQSFDSVWVEGEISNLNIAGSGHAYFTLKDPRAALPAVMWRSAVQRLRFRLTEGQRLRVFGRLGIYSTSGKFQLYAERAEPAGLGELMAELEALKRKLAAEGLFDPARKRSLPRWPRCIGIVTSTSGAALHDVLKVVGQRCPSRVIVVAAAVQGDNAPYQLREGVRRLGAHPDVEVIIVGRGGGSMEDLWAFNNEGLVRAILACPVPVISAVGHEIDQTLCDLVADVRAATPSHAGELVVPDIRGIGRDLVAATRRLRLACERRVLDESGRIDDLTRRLERRGRAIVGEERSRMVDAGRRLERSGRTLPASRRRRLEDLRIRLRDHHPRARAHADRRRDDQLGARLIAAGQGLATVQRRRLERAIAKLDALSPIAVLERGYAVATTGGGRIVRDANDVAPGDDVRVRLASGHLDTRVVAQGSKDEP
jgi:exodeoxyribonuclease VII large subunit